MAKLIITEGDTADWVYQLVDPETGEPLNLTGATVKLYMWSLPEQSIVIDGGSCTHNDTGGAITYSPALADVDDPGEYQIQYKVTLLDGSTKRYPDLNVDSRFTLVIEHAVEGQDTQG